MNKRESIRCTYSTAPRPESAQTCPMRCWSRPRPPQTAEKGYRTERGTKTNDQHEKNICGTKKQNSDGSYLSSLSRQCTRIGRIPDLIRSSMGGLRSLDSSFLQEEVNNSQQDASHSNKSHTTVIEETLTKHWTVITKHHDEL